MEPRIGNLHIKNFRVFRDLHIERLGRVNLITGKNNTGKSSVLEALRILASGASPDVLALILRSREEYIEDKEGEKDNGDRLPETRHTAQMLSSFFHGFRAFSPQTSPIEISTDGDREPSSISIAANLIDAKDYINGNWKVSPQKRTGSREGNGVLSVNITTDGNDLNIPLDLFHRLCERGQQLYFPPPDSPCMTVSAYGGERTANLATLWDSVTLTDEECEVIRVLHIVAPDIEAISMVGGEDFTSRRTALVRATNLKRPVPLRSFGDGLSRVFGIALNLVNAKGGLLLIDEFENGMHHTVQTDVWRAIFKLAKRLDVQVFATSHSWDAIEAFQKAAREDAEEGVLIRLTRRGDDIIPTLFSEDELAIATREGIEVR